MTSMTTPDERIVQGVVLFNRAQWRDALLAFESVWVETRDGELKALIQLANLTMQLHLGYFMSPRRLIVSALQLLDDATGTSGVDLVAMRHTLNQLAACIPDCNTDVLDIRTLPKVELRWRHGNS